MERKLRKGLEKFFISGGAFLSFIEGMKVYQDITNIGYTENLDFALLSLGVLGVVGGVYSIIKGNL